MSLESSRVFPALKAGIFPALPPFSEVARVPDDDASAIVSVLTPEGMKPLITITLHATSFRTAWADPRGRRNPEPWFSSHWLQWENILRDVVEATEAVMLATLAGKLGEHRVHRVREVARSMAGDDA